MRETEVEDELMGSDQTRFYQEMYDKQLASQLSGNGSGLGLAEIMVRQLQGGMASPAEEGDAPGLTMPERQPFTVRRQQPAGTAPSDGEPRFESPEAFVKALWPQAQKAAAQLGVAPQALLAQAALETGWGKAVIRHPDGTSSHNLFNIKADGRWDGEQVTKQTLEYRDGVAQRESAQFRSYGSYTESFEDYVDFLHSNPRYRAALEQAHDPKAFIDALQEAGYATDPDYARKINEIIDRDTLAGFKSDQDQTLS
jgi:flagellar protein FlgJ